MAIATMEMKATATTATMAVGKATTAPKVTQAIVATQAIEAIAGAQKGKETAGTPETEAIAGTSETEVIAATQQAMGIKATIEAAKKAAPMGLMGAAIPQPTATGPRMQIRTKAGRPGREILQVPEGHRAKEIRRAKEARADPRTRASGIHRIKAEGPSPHNLQDCPQSLAPSQTAFGPS